MISYKDLFVAFTTHTCPYGGEGIYDNYLTSKGCTKDKYGNWFVEIGTSRSVFSAHLDTVGTAIEDVKHVFDGRFIKTDGKTILGADDKAGVVVLLAMIDNKVPGLYYFFVGEEVGGQGSSKVVITDKDRMISFDRRGTCSIITRQMKGICCSDMFASALSNEFYEKGKLFLNADSTGSFTDSANFIDSIKECTNISVGYNNEHSNREQIDIGYLDLLCDAVVKIDWEALPVDRIIIISKANKYAGTYDYYNNKWYGEDEDWDDWEKWDYKSDGYKPVVSEPKLLSTARQLTKKEQKAWDKHNVNKIKHKPKINTISLHANERVYSKTEQFSIPIDEAVYSDYHESWVYWDECVWSDAAYSYVIKDLCDYMGNDWIPKDFYLSEFFNNTYAKEFAAEGIENPTISDKLIYGD